MRVADRDRLREIKTFPSLVKYLRDELDWPIDSDHIDDYTYDYEPEELGLDTQVAAKIQEIKQLRPLTTNQPWGIFFLKFEPKRLPVVALRRILSSLVIKKRESSRKADRPAWHRDDLLFISAYGESGDRRISFAHFYKPEDGKDLPTLRVLGWDNADTPLHLDHVHSELKDKLRWPEDEKDLEGWRKSWASAFTLRHRQVIRTSQDLAVQLAGLARVIRDRANTILRVESDKGPLRRLHKAFQSALIHDLSEDDFADMYAQTITYGLFSAAVSGDGRGKRMAVAVGDLSKTIPLTNPFLRDLLETFLKAGGRKNQIDFDELGVQEVVDVLNSPDTHLDAVLRDFGRQKREEDPVIHFYEVFLAEYDRKKRIQRGVFYTPQPVVSYIVRSVHELLQTEFGLEDGLASTVTWEEMAERHQGLKIPEGTKPTDPFVVILDPATGTATFLVEVIDVIYKTLAAKWEKQRLTEGQRQEAWNDYVPKHLLPRLHGYELMMAPYAIAHMKFGLKLYETGYLFGGKERARIYLTNALEPPQTFSNRLAFDAPALAHEAESVNAIKGRTRYTVVIGNPPYSKMSANLSDTAVGLIEPFRYLEGARIVVKAALAHELNLQDDYVKFFGLLIRTLSQSGTGIGSYISNFGYLDSPSLRGMRWGFLQFADLIKILNLGGRVADRRLTTETDQNVFEIEQGVATSFLLRRPIRKAPRSIMYGRLSGTRDDKHKALSCSTIAIGVNDAVEPISPYYRFVPSDNEAEGEFNKWRALDEIFPMNSGGIITSRDSLSINMDEDSLIAILKRFANTARGDTSLQREIGYSVKAKWDVEGCKAALRAKAVTKQDIKPIFYRPFDVRNIYYYPPLLDTPSRPVSVMVYRGKNLLILAPRVKTTNSFCHVLLSRHPAETKSCTHDRATQMFPVFIRNPLDPQTPQLNVSHEIARTFIDLVALEGADVWSLGHMFAGYIYALLHSSKYRLRYGDALKNSYPRVPFPLDGGLVKELADLGSKLSSIHLMESPNLDNHPPAFIGPTQFEVGRVGWSNETVWLDAPPTPRGATAAPRPGTIGFKGVPEDVWNFHVGGYQVCEKWLKDRRGRTLSQEDITHYQKIVVALSETIRLMREIDEVIEKHGGWPGAFAGGR